jgi:cytochrome P450
MVYFNAAIKVSVILILGLDEILNLFGQETLRLYPIVMALFRDSDRDDVIPLDEPILSASGEQLKEIPVKKGQRIIVSIYHYNRWVYS